MRPARGRRARRADLLAEHVVSGFLRSELADALARSYMDENSVYALISMLMNVEQPGRPGFYDREKWDLEEVRINVGRFLAPLRVDPVYREGLLAYGGEPKGHTRQCLGCSRKLELPAPGRPGRRREHCSNRCRQYVYRLRKILREQPYTAPETTARTPVLADIPPGSQSLVSGVAQIVIDGLAGDA